MGGIARRSRRTALLGLMIASAACATAGAPGESLDDPDLILRAEIEEGTARNAYDLIQSRRPQWFRTRGLANLRQAAGEEDIVVYMDNARLGFRDSLERVALASVEYIQFFSAPQATQRWGGGHIHGAILLSTRRRNP